MEKMIDWLYELEPWQNMTISLTAGALWLTLCAIFCAWLFNRLDREQYKLQCGYGPDEKKLRELDIKIRRDGLRAGPHGTVLGKNKDAA